MPAGCANIFAGVVWIWGLNGMRLSFFFALRFGKKGVE